MNHAFYSISTQPREPAIRPNMNLRFYTYLALLSLSESAAAASNAAWNCEQGPNGQWTCLNKGQTAPTTPPVPASKPQAQPEVVAKPTPAESGTPAPAVAKPEPAVVSAPAVAAPSKTEAPAMPASAETVETLKAAASALNEGKKLHVRMAEHQKPVIEDVTEQPTPRDKAPQPAVAGGREGWTCKSSGDDKKAWNCNLVGPDPKDKPQLASASTSSSSSQSLTPSVLFPTYSPQQERRFQTLRREFSQDPWQNCSNWALTNKRKHKKKVDTQRDDAETLVDADASEIFQGDVLSFAGNVDLHRGDQHLVAERASYNSAAESLDAQGNVLYSDAGMALSGDSVSLGMVNNEARLRDTQFVLAEAPLRGTAAAIYRDNKILSRYQDVSFTSCPPGNQDWIGHAEKLKINRDTGQGSAKNAWLEFKGVPFLYTPYISFPTDDRRLSGMLAPTWGTSQRNGFDVSAPFYWNIAPNFDDTITPRYMARRGEMLRNKFRYLTESSEGMLAGEYLPNDQLLNKSRYLGSFRDKTHFGDHWHMLTNLNFVSDKTYFNDLNNPLGIQTNRYLPSTALLSYGRPEINFSAGLQHYQSLDQALDNRSLPYDVLPKVSLNLQKRLNHLPVALAMNNQFAYFYNQDRVNGQRFNIAPSISLPLESSAAFFIPKITGQYTQYSLSNQTQLASNSIYDLAAPGTGRVNESGMPTSISRMLPIFSVDTGMTFERETSFGNTPYTHTLEPRAFYLYIPRKDQSNIPIFDTAAYDTNFYSLFRENKYSGLDRIQDANQITLAASTRYINGATGLEPVKLSLGQIIYFQDRQVSLDYNGNYGYYQVGSDPLAWHRLTRPRQNSTTSNFVSELSGQVSRELSYTTGLQWDPQNNGFSRGQAALKFRTSSNQVLNIGYRYRRSLPTDQSLLPNDQALIPLDPYATSTLPSAYQQSISQSDVSFRLPLFNDWYGLGRWQYAFNYDKTSESFLGVEKESCCWRFRIIGRRYLNGANFANINAKPENAVFVQVELKGFTSFGDNVEQFLQRNINGYRPANYYED